MHIRISKESGVTIREQLVAQIVHLIATGQLKPGNTLPSVRALARRLGIHRNTVSQAYRHLADDHWLIGRRGRPSVVRSPDEPVRSLPGNHLDELINSFVQEVRKHGYSLQELRQHVRARLLTQPPDHLLVVEQELGLRHLLRAEFRDKLAFRVEACSTDELALNPDLAIGALVVSPPGGIKYFETLLPRDRPAIPISFCTVNEHVEVIRELQQPSIIVLASVSEVCLEVARGVLSGVVGRRHSLQVYLLAGARPRLPGAADIVLCDSIAYPVLRPQLKGGNVILYRLIAPDCLEHISSIMTDSASDDAPGNDHEREKAQARNR